MIAKNIVYSVIRTADQKRYKGVVRMQPQSKVAYTYDRALKNAREQAEAIVGAYRERGIRARAVKGVDHV